MDLSKVAEQKTKDGSRVRVQTLRLVLRCIDDHASKSGGKAYPSYDTIALESDCKRRQAMRAVEILVAASLLVKRPRSRVIGGKRVTVNHYDIVWAEVALLARSRPESSAVATALRSEGEWSAVARESSAVAREWSAVATAPKPPRTNRQERTASPQPPVEADSAEWELAAAELLRFGISAARSLVREVRSRYAPAEFLALVVRAIATAQANAGLFSNPPGAVYAFLRDGVWPAEGVVSLEEIQRREEARARAEEAAAQDRLARERERDDEDRDRLELETVFGPVLNGFARDELHAFAARVFSNDAFRLDRLRRSAELSRFDRLELLKALRAGRGAFLPAASLSGDRQ